MTKLKALELFGFKSFADRTRFEFPDGITVVVGPNGSGKSNVVDAIKWVLGEQSARSLRGKEMTDVIFAGSTGRKPLNAAEVALVFDNSARLLPVDSGEVQIMRRVYRNGESEYLVNGEPSRLRDIRELFSGTGAATEAYSVIEQGRVDALLVASGRDRRAVFEEAAGITKFRVRRTESLRRLERAEQNRQRLADIVGEVSSRLETVRHQAAKARRWSLMTDRLRGLRIAASTQDLAAVDATVRDVEAALAATRALLLEAESQAADAAAESAALAAEAEQSQPLVAAARAARVAEAQRLAAAEATLALQRARRSDIEQEVAWAEEGLRGAVAAERAAGAAGADVAAAAEELSGRLQRLATHLHACEQAAQGSHHDAAEARRRIVAAEAAVAAHREEQVRLQAAGERAEARAAELRRAADAARDAADAARLLVAKLAESHAAWEGTLGSLEGRLQAADREVEGLEARQRDTAAAIDNAWRELSGWQAKLEACRERRAMLHEIVAKHDGISDAARRLLAEGASVPGLAGVLADIIVASIDWAPLVDVALGSLGQSLVVESLADAVHWHADWSASAGGRDALGAGGRIGFVAAESLPSPPPYEPDAHPGLVGRLDALVMGEPGGSDAGPLDDTARLLLPRLLGKVWVVERIEHALPMLPGAPAGTLFMTRTGQCLSADGTFEIGTPTAAAGLVSRRSELRALEQRHDELSRTTEAASASIESLQADLAALQADARQARSRRQHAAEAIATARADMDRVQRETASARVAVADAEREVREADHRAAEATAASHAAARVCQTAAPALEAAQVEVAEARATIEALERSRGEVIDEIHRLRVEQATVTEKLARSREVAAACTAAVAARRGDVEAAAARRRKAAARIETHELELLAAGAEYAETAVAVDRTTAELADILGAFDRIESGRRHAAVSLEEARTATVRLAEDLHALELEAGEARHRRARIVERIRDEYDIEIDATAPHAPAAATPPVEIPADRADLDREIEELRRKLASMTSVNMEALAEAEELTARLEKLEAQLTDVTNAKESIEQLISRIDDESRRLLGETIETVRGHFRELFERVFGGGQADIVLEPGVDLLETSVEIIARPPGKEPRNISLLSGGEKTMTCVALLLAIFRSRPSPFCVLDEVDAALDEANVDRFANVLKDFLSSTQVIVVTHSKKTMAAATTLYGVTMEESGVSKRVSVRFESTAAAVTRSGGARAA